MKKLKQYLIDKKLTQREFAELIGVNSMTLWHYLHGSRIPRIKIMKKITELTNGYVTANDFFGEIQK